MKPRLAKVRAWRSLRGYDTLRTADHARHDSIAKMPDAGTEADARPAQNDIAVGGGVVAGRAPTGAD